ncbi:MAG: type II secretion system F family protein [Thermoguttaceae bacterium]
MTLDQFIALNDEISAIVRSGVPLEQGLAELGGDMPGRLGQIATALAERSARGESLDKCLTDEMIDMPPAYRAVVQAGMRAGRLPAALEAVAGSARRLTDTYRAVVVAVSYPLLIFALAWIGAAVFTSLLAPQLAAGFRSMDLPCQRFFAMLCWLGRGAWYWGPVGPVFAVGLVTAWWLACRGGALLGEPEGATRSIAAQPKDHPGKRRRFSSPAIRLLTGLPWMGRMLRWSRTATFLEILSLLVESETPLPEAIELAARASGDPQTVHVAQQLATRLTLGDCAAAAGVIDSKAGLPPLLGWLMASAGREGTLLPALRHAAATYHRRARHQADIVRTLLPVLLTVVFGGGITAMYVLALFVPYTTMLNALALP